MKEELSASEALWAFAGWLTSLEEPVTFSACHSATTAVDMIAEFCIENNLSEPRRGWEDNFSWPKSRELFKDSHQQPEKESISKGV